MHTVTLDEFARDLLEHGRRIGNHIFMQDCEQTGAGVLRIDVDPAGSKRRERDFGRSKSRTPLDTHTTLLENLGEHFGQKKGFTEGLRRDDYRPSILPRILRAE